METVAVAVVGSRDFPSRTTVEVELYRILKKANANSLRLHIITGGARGVDTWAEEWAKRNQIMYTVIPAQWNIHGKSAGFARNHDIWNLAEAGIAFWDGTSRGTQHSFVIAKKHGKKLKVITEGKRTD